MVRRKDDAVVAIQKNRFAALESDSEYEEQDAGQDDAQQQEHCPSPQQPETPPITPVIKEERKSYAAALTRGTTKGWVSIKWQGPQFVDDDDELSEKEVVKEALEEAGVLESCVKEGDESGSAEMSAPSAPAPATGPAQDSSNLKPLWNRSTNTAVVWADRVKKTLEKAEADRKPHFGSFKPTEDFVSGVGRLSFFRKEQ